MLLVLIIKFCCADSGSIWDNIALGTPNASAEQVEEAAKAANAHDFIVKLPSGYDTEVGGSGTGIHNSVFQIFILFIISIVFFKSVLNYLLSLSSLQLSIVAEDMLYLFYVCDDVFYVQRSSLVVRSSALPSLVRSAPNLA